MTPEGRSQGWSRGLLVRVRSTGRTGIVERLNRYGKVVVIHQPMRGTSRNVRITYETKQIERIEK